LQSETSVAGGGEAAGGLDRFGEAAAHWPKDEGGHLALGNQGDVSGFAWEFPAHIQLQTRFAQEFGGKAHIGSAIHSPEPELLFVALEKVEGLLQLFHGAVKGGRQKKDGEGPCMPGVVHLNANAILASLITLDAAAVGILSG